MNLHLYSIPRFWRRRREIDWIVFVRLTNLNWKCIKIYVDNRHCRVSRMHFEAMAIASFCLPSFLCDEFGGEKEFICTLSFEFIAIIKRAIELKSISKPPETHTRRYSFRISNQTRMNIKMPSLVCARILDSSSSLPAIFPPRFCIVFGCELVSGFRCQSCHYILNNSEPIQRSRFFFRGNIFAFLLLLSVCHRTSARTHWDLCIQ